MGIALRVLSFLGVLLFGSLFAITFVSPATIEESAKGFVKYQIEKEVKEQYETVSESTLANKALSLAGKLGFEKEEIQNNLDNNLPEKIANVIASLCGYDCERKKALASSITAGYLERIKSIEIAEDTLSDIIKGKYLEIVQNIKLDIRIFLGTNIAMFLILLLISFFKPQAMAQLFLPGVLLLLATIISSGIYIFGQDWFYTILYNEYMGFGYLAYISLIFGFLMDIVFNKARVTTEIINFIANAIGSAFSAVPC